MNTPRAASRRAAAIGVLLFALALLPQQAAAAGVGTLDPGFGSGGKVTTALSTNSAGVNALLLQSDGKLVAAGFGGDGFALARYNGNGTLDGSFGSGGTVLTPISGGGAAYAAALQADGKIVLAGRTADFNFVLARYNSNGTLDGGFGIGGVVITDFGGNDGAFGVAVSDDQIVAVGNTDRGGYKVAVARYNGDGSLDTTFDSDGKVISAIGANSSAQVVHILDGGKVLVGGTSNSDFLLIRYNANGSLDSSFGGNPTGPGWARTDFGPRAAAVKALDFTFDGLIVAGGFALNSTDLALARYSANGVLDTTFGTAGKVTTNVRGSDEINGLVIQENGKIIAAGGSGEDTVPNFTLTRYNTNGSLDGGFGGVISTTGILTTPFGTNSSIATAIVLQPDGNVVVAGQMGQSTNTSSSFALARYLTPMFTDVDPVDFFYTPVVYLSGHNVISGYADGGFRPFNNATRGQVAKIVVLAENIPIQTPATPTFVDVADNNVYYPFIETAAARGIIGGYNTDRGREFRYNLDVTRGQLAKIVVKAAGWSLVAPDQPTFNDVPATNPFYLEIETAVQHGIISGYSTPNGLEFRWFNQATRGQISKIVYIAATAPTTGTVTLPSKAKNSDPGTKGK